MPKPTADVTPTPDPAHFTWAKFAWEAAKSIVIGLAAVFSFFANQSSESAKQEAEKANRTLAERSQQSQLDIKAYELVEKALSLDAAARKAHGIAAAAIVNALTRPPLREELQNALRAGVNDPGLIRQLDDARQFDQESYGFGASNSPAQDKRSSAPASGGLSFLNPVSIAWAAAGTLEGYRVDIFYCEGSTPAMTAAREARAKQASQKLQKSGVQVVARVRLLPTLVQARAGYQSFSDEIRFNGGGEREAAQQLANIVGIDGRSVNQIEYRTPQYLSVFYCAGK
jgi:hypothetical protein